MPRRRRFLHGTALALAAGLAGCSDGGDGGGGGDDGDGGSDGGDGDAGSDGGDGTDGTDGTDGEDGSDGTDGDGGTDETVTDVTTGGEEVTSITVAPGGSLSFDPDDLTVSVGETVQWVWDGGGHNVVVEEMPEGSSWGGDPDDLYGSGHTHEHTFEVAGEYSYYCNPHRGSGMVGSVTVEE